MRVRSFVLSCVMTFATSASALAQQSPWGLGLSVSKIDYDLSGTGSAPGFAVRASRDLTPHVGLEVRGLFARPEQQSGPAALFAPDLQLQYRWNIARFSPYVGGGVGFALIKSDFRTDWDATTSVAAGADVRLTERVGVFGEVRIRGFEWDFVGSTGEFSAGLTWVLPSF